MPAAPAVGGAAAGRWRRACSITSSSALGARLGERGQQRTGDLRAGGVAAGVRDPAAQVTAFPGQRQRAGRLAVELRAEVDQPPHRAGPSVTSARTASHVAEAGAGASACPAGAALASRPGRARRRRRPAPSGSSRRRARDLVASRIRAAGSARRIASTVVTPATPEPTTTTSVSLRQPGGGASRRPGDHAAASPPRSGSRAGCALSISRVVPTRGGDQQQRGPAMAGPDLGEGIRIGEHQVVELHRRARRGGRSEHGPAAASTAAAPWPATAARGRQRPRQGQRARRARPATGRRCGWMSPARRGRDAAARPRSARRGQGQSPSAGSAPAAARPSRRIPPCRARSAGTA